MQRLKNSWSLAKASWEVLKKDKELALLPVMALIFGIIAGAVFFVPAAASTDAEGNLGGLGMILIALGGLAFTFVNVFFQGALVHGANERLTGGDPTVSSAIKGAAARINRLLPWAIIVATVNVILRIIRDRVPSVGRFISAIAEGAWDVLTFLVMPIMIIEDVGPIDAIKSSSSMFRKTWGENLAARVGFAIIGFIAMIPAILVIVLGFSLGGLGAIVLIAIAVVWIGVVAASLAALSAIFQTALYWYATQGKVAEGFGDELTTAFGQR